MTISKLINNLMVADVRASADFYRNCLGFELVMAVPDGTHDAVQSFSDGVDYCFAVVKHGDVEIMLQSAESAKEEFPDISFSGDGSGTILYMQVKDVEGLFSLVKNNQNIIKGLHEAFYGMKEFYMKDPDGYILGFAEKG
ncbi:Glyoxalase/bleomycin resistance protein/dioxygenase [Denitrovibrio acetiphilus DSM 12809]|uniref:Glyoxalase/bleomycin resistance protein/dioxygenase n=1 Tax=Denitrovibrio acetiphilus (strain DSM 12809 / NBRC 114555 / N2460) TaxID=522772 RepID=D4H1L5_DENA2|nr:VOC family protein [Denitrovibrio acetiphilus]ADD68775.1 Glyoxalase/bleomycin resistance protein/dioxygenase [Denitrovibrio acetiphilus DSM 12809]